MLTKRVSRESAGQSVPLYISRTVGSPFLLSPTSSRLMVLQNRYKRAASARYNNGPVTRAPTASASIPSDSPALSPHPPDTPESDSLFHDLSIPRRELAGNAYRYTEHVNQAHELTEDGEAVLARDCQRTDATPDFHVDLRLEEEESAELTAFKLKQLDLLQNGGHEASTGGPDQVDQAALVDVDNSFTHLKSARPGRRPPSSAIPTREFAGAQHARALQDGARRAHSARRA